MADGYEITQIRQTARINDVGEISDWYEIFAVTPEGDRFTLRYPTSATRAEMEKGLTVEAKKLTELHKS